MRHAKPNRIAPQAPVGAVSYRTASAQLETAPTMHKERKRLFIFKIYYKWTNEPTQLFCTPEVKSNSQFARCWAISYLTASEIRLHSKTVLSLDSSRHLNKPDRAPIHNGILSFTGISVGSDTCSNLTLKFAGARFLHIVLIPFLITNWCLAQKLIDNRWRWFLHRLVYNR